MLIKTRRCMGCGTICSHSIHPYARGKRFFGTTFEPAALSQPERVDPHPHDPRSHQARC